MVDNVRLASIIHTHLSCRGNEDRMTSTNRLGSIEFRSVRNKKEKYKKRKKIRQFLRTKDEDLFDLEKIEQ